MDYPIFEEGEVGYDMDDVLVNLHDPLIEFHNHKFGTTFTFDNHISYDLSKVWGVSGVEASDRFDMFYNSPFFGKVKLYSGAKEFIEKLGKGPIITSRPKTIFDKTVNFVENNLDGKISRVFFSDSGKRKLHFIKEHGIKLFVEDCLTYANEIANAGIPVMLIDFGYPYNQGETHNNVHRALSYEQALKIGARIRMEWASNFFI